MNDIDLNQLRAVATEAMRYDGAVQPRPWGWTGVGDHGYPQRIIVVGPAILVAETFEHPGHPSRYAEHIATFDPPTVLALLNAIDEHHRDFCRIKEIVAEGLNTGLRRPPTKALEAIDRIVRPC